MMIIYMKFSPVVAEEIFRQNLAAN